jgi:hypothetical protein
LLLVISIKLLMRKELANLWTSVLGCPRIFIQQVHCTGWVVSNCVRLALMPSNVQQCSDTPTYVVYHELILTSKEYMTQVTSVDAYWLGKCLYICYRHESPDNPSLQLSWGLSSIPSRRRTSTTGAWERKQIVNSLDARSWRRRWQGNEKSKSIRPVQLHIRSYSPYKD